MHLEALMDLGLYHEMESKNYEMLHYLKGLKITCPFSNSFPKAK